MHRPDAVEAGAGSDFRIGEAVRHPAGQYAGDDLDAPLGLLPDPPPGESGGVRGQHHVVAIHQGIAREVGLVLEDVEARAGDPPLIQGLGKGAIVDQRADARY